jgi:hypothetical protein
MPAGSRAPLASMPKAPPRGTPVGRVVARSNVAPLPTINAGTLGVHAAGMAGAVGGGLGAGTGAGAGSSSLPPHPAIAVTATASPCTSHRRRSEFTSTCFLSPLTLLVAESISRSALRDSDLLVRATIAQVVTPFRRNSSRRENSAPRSSRSAGSVHEKRRPLRREIFPRCRRQLRSQLVLLV